MEGFVKLHRKVLESNIMLNSKMFHFFFWCVLKASHKERIQRVGYQDVPLKRGQFIFGLHSASEQTGLSIRSIRTILDKLKKSKKLTSKTTNKFSIITVCNYDIYQHKEDGNDSQGDKQRASKGQAKGNKQESKDCIDSEELNKNISEIFAHWNSLKVIVHREFTDKHKAKINTILKTYSKERIMSAMTNYATVQKGSIYYWDHKWVMVDFLTRGLEKFLDESSPMENFKRKENQGPTDEEVFGKNKKL